MIILCVCVTYQVLTSYCSLFQGMFTPDREPHPAVHEIKYLQQPVVFSSLDSSLDISLGKSAPLLVAVTESLKASVPLRITNRYVFSDLAHISWLWELTSDRSDKPIRSTSFQLAEQDGSGGLVLRLDSAVTRVEKLEFTRPAQGNKYFLNIRGFLREKTSWAEAGLTLVTQQFPVNFVFEKTLQLKEEKSPKLSARLEVTEEEKTVEVFRDTDGGSIPLVVLDKQSGAIVSFAPNGKNVLTDAMLPNFTRAVTDNDKGGIELAIDFMFPIKGFSHIFGLLRGYEDFSYDSHWRTADLDQSNPPKVVCRHISVEENKQEGVVDIVAECSVLQAVKKGELFKVTFRYRIFSDGRVRILQHVVPQSVLRWAPSVPRVGMNLVLDPSLFHIQYFGRGPGENYPDRKSGSELGVYGTTPLDMGYDKYIVPGENGSRSECEWIAFREQGTGDGVCIVSDTGGGKHTSFSSSALLHSARDLHFATHTCDLPRRTNGHDPIHVNVDHKIMGVGGDNRYVFTCFSRFTSQLHFTDIIVCRPPSWYPVVYKDYLVKTTGDFTYGLWLVPLKKDDDAAVSARHL
jgi:beta-galactosidase